MRGKGCAKGPQLLRKLLKGLGFPAASTTLAPAPTKPGPMAAPSRRLPVTVDPILEREGRWLEPKYSSPRRGEHPGCDGGHGGLTPVQDLAYTRRS